MENRIFQHCINDDDKEVKSHSEMKGAMRESVVQVYHNGHKHPQDVLLVLYWSTPLLSQ